MQLVNVNGKETNLTGYICKLIVDAIPEDKGASMKIFTTCKVPHIALKPEAAVVPKHIDDLKVFVREKGLNWDDVVVAQVKKLGYSI